MGDGDAAHFRVAAFRRKNSQLRTGSTSLSLSLSLANLATIVKTKFSGIISLPSPSRHRHY